jgi:hypothetical protein
MVKAVLAGIFTAMVLPGGLALAAGPPPAPAPPGGGNFINSCVAKPNDLVGSANKLDLGSCNPTPTGG